MKSILSSTLAGALLTISAVTSPAQTLNVIYNFTPAIYADASEGWGFTNTDGAHPYCRPVLSGTKLYGTTQVGGNGSGTLFSVNTDGTGYTVLHTFVDSEGSSPSAGMIVSGKTLYGTTTGGGGAIFSINTDGTGFAVLHACESSPMAEVTLAGGTLYGTTEDGVFSLNADGSAYTDVHLFTQAFYKTAARLYTNWDGADSWGSVVAISNVLYGTASTAGPNGYGTIFSVNADGSSYTVLHAFANGADGATPQGGLTLAGNVLYGTTSDGGANGQGTLFSINLDGSDYAILHNFDGSPGGANPRENLTFSGGMLYGTTLNGGTGAGTIFAIDTNGANYSVLCALDDSADGNEPEGGLALSGNTFYGTTSYGGTNGGGTLFSLQLPMPVISSLSIQGTSAIVTATNGLPGSNCTLLTSAECSAPMCQWTPLASGSFDTNGDSTVIATNAVAPGSTQGFFALRTIR